MAEKIEVKMKSRTFRKCSWISVLLKQQFLIQASKIVNPECRSPSSLKYLKYSKNPHVRT